METYKILNGISNVNPATWFTRNVTAEAATLLGWPLSVKLTSTRLELRRNFFTVRVCQKMEQPAK